MNNLLLKEKTAHGSADFPFHIISHQDTLGTYSVPYHWHDEIEIIYLEYGNINIYCNEQEYHLEPNQFYIINANELHQILGVTPSLHHAIIFHPSLLDFSLFDKTEEQFIRPITSGNAKFISQIYQDHNYDFIINNLVNTDTHDYLSIKISLYNIINIFYKNHLIEIDTNPNKHEDLKKVILYIQNNFNKTLTLDMIAKQIMISPNHLCKYFKKNMGITVFQYINQYKINQSINYLLHSKLTIIEIAMNCGFDNISYFIRTFKKITGFTPKQYRNQNQKENS